MFPDSLPELVGIEIMGLVVLAGVYFAAAAIAAARSRSLMMDWRPKLFSGTIQLTHCISEITERAHIFPVALKSGRRETEWGKIGGLFWSLSI